MIFNHQNQWIPNSMEQMETQYAVPTSPASSPSMVDDSKYSSTHNPYDSMNPTLDAYTDQNAAIGPESYDPLSQFFTGKKVFLDQSVEELVGVIDERQHLRDNIAYKIDYESTQSRTRLFQLDLFDTGSNPSVDKIRTNIHHELLNFEKEKRMEDVACWRDVNRIKTELRHAVRELEQEKRKQDLFT